jgi:DNA-binding transcriptional MerR regulator
MADRNSSNDLILEQIRELLEERRRDSMDGINLRALNRQLSEHTIADEKRHDAIDERIREVEQTISRVQGEATGRFNIAPVHTVVVPPMSANGNRNSRRPSTSPPWIVEVTKKPAMIILIALATVLAHALLKLLH